MPLSIVALVPPVLHVSVDDCPGAIVNGLPPNEYMQPCPDESRSEKFPQSSAM